MNFLFHHYLARRDLGSLAGATGAMLPDLWRLADRRVRPRSGALVATEEGLAPLERDVLAGIRHHVEVDRWFHGAPAFREGEALTAARLREVTVGARRLPLFAHVLWEMCLDGALLDRVGLEAMRRDMSDGLRVVESAGAGERAADLCHFAGSDRTEAERYQFRSRMRVIVERLSTTEWIDGYATGEGLADRLNGIRRGLGFPPFDETDRTVVANLCAGLLGAAADVARELTTRPR